MEAESTATLTRGFWTRLSTICLLPQLIMWTSTSCQASLELKYWEHQMVRRWTISCLGFRDYRIVNHPHGLACPPPRKESLLLRKVSKVAAFRATGLTLIIIR